MTSDSEPSLGRLVARGLTDVRSVREILWPAFVAGNGAGATLDYQQDVDMTRLREEVGGASRGARPDVLIVADPILFARDGLLAEQPVTNAGSRPAAWEDASGRWTAIYVQPIVAVYNALYVETIRSWAELGDDRWHRRIALEAPERMLTTGPAFAELRDAMGDADWQPWLEEIARQEVRQVADNERAVLEVATGSRWVGLANLNVARRVRSGSPVQHVFLDPTPLVPAFAVVVADGPSPELGRRFAGWLASPDGQAAITRTGRIPAAGVGLPSAARPDAIPAAVEVVAGRADWIADPDRWIATFRGIFPTDQVKHAGKRRD